MVYELMYIPNDDTKNYPCVYLECLDTRLNGPTNQNSKLLSQGIRKRYYL